jgi:hypothetical protein
MLSAIAALDGLAAAAAQLAAILQSLARILIPRSRTMLALEMAGRRLMSLITAARPQLQLTARIRAEVIQTTRPTALAVHQEIAAMLGKVLMRPDEGRTSLAEPSWTLPSGT